MIGNNARANLALGLAQGLGAILQRRAVEEEKAMRKREVAAALARADAIRQQDMDRADERTRATLLSSGRYMPTEQAASAIDAIQGGVTGVGGMGKMLARPDVNIGGPLTLVPKMVAPKQNGFEYRGHVYPTQAEMLAAYEAEQRIGAKYPSGPRFILPDPIGDANKRGDLAKQVATTLVNAAGGNATKAYQTGTRLDSPYRGMLKSRANPQGVVTEADVDAAAQSYANAQPPVDPVKQTVADLLAQATAEAKGETPKNQDRRGALAGQKKPAQSPPRSTPDVTGLERQIQEDTDLTEAEREDLLRRLRAKARR